MVFAYAASFVLGFGAYLSPAQADSTLAANDPSETSYILNFDHWTARFASGPAAGFDIGPNFGAVSSPSGASLPDASAHFNAGDNADKVTHFTPRFGNLQLSWSGHHSPSQPSDSISGDTSSSETFELHTRSVGVSFTQEIQDVELSIGGDYGTSPSSVPGAVDLVEDEALLRVGAHARFKDFIIGGMFGSDIDGNKNGETISWDAFGRYDIGALSVGMVYNYTIGLSESGSQEEEIAGTLQAGMSYSFTPSMAITSNFVYGGLASEDGSDEAGIAGVLGFSLDF